MKPGRYNYLKFRGMITGSRYLVEPANRTLVVAWMDKLRQLAKIAYQIDEDQMIWGVGDCPTGPDLFGWEYLKTNLLAFERFEADWTVPNKMGGPERNNRMIEAIQPTHTLAFMHPRARGTVGCANRAQPISRVYRIYAKGVYTSTAAGEPVPPPFDWRRLSETV